MLRAAADTTNIPFAGYQFGSVKPMWPKTGMGATLSVIGDHCRGFRLSSFIRER
jgi:hypothetical protein